jgi:hypothetical protein
MEMPMLVEIQRKITTPYMKTYMQFCAHLEISSLNFDRLER